MIEGDFEGFVVVFDLDVVWMLDGGGCVIVLCKLFVGGM